MPKKTKVELEKDKIAKVTRAMIRLKHSIKADEEINEVLFDRLAEFEKGLQSGVLLELPIPKDI